MLYILTLLLSAIASYYVHHSISDIHLDTSTLSTREEKKGIFYLAFRFPRIYTVCCRVSKEYYLCVPDNPTCGIFMQDTVEGRNTFRVSVSSRWIDILFQVFKWIIRLAKT